MQLLLDTHTFIWFMAGDLHFPNSLKNIIEVRSNKCVLSIASVWEMAIKTSLGKLVLKGEFDKIADFLSENDIESLPVSFEHIQQLL